MTQIFYHKLSTPFSIKKWAFYYPQMPEDIQERIRRYRKEENKYQLMIGRLLLKEGMQQLGFKDFKLADLYYNEFNCPLWRENINFNIAHSANVIACAFSTTRKIGLDVEEIRRITLSDFAYILNEADKENIQKSTNKLTAFFKIWTIKEAVTKAIGKGLSIDVQQIYIHEKYAVFEGQKWYYQTLDLAENIAGHIVMEEEAVEPIKLITLDF